MMKKKLFYLFCLILLSSLLHSQTREYVAYPVQNRFGLYLAGAVDRTIPIGMDIDGKFGYDANVGFLYEYNKNDMLFDVGIGVAFLRNTIVPTNAYTTTTTTKDLDGNTFDLITSVNPKEDVCITVAEIPLAIGKTWNKAYILGGIRIGVKILDFSKIHGNINFSGDYDRYIENFTGNSEQGFRTAKFSKKSATFLTNKASLMLEAGINLHTFEVQKYIMTPRLGLYLNASTFLPTIGTVTEAFSLEDNENPYNVDSYKFNSVMQKGSNILLDAEIGLKFTFLVMNKRRTPKAGGLYNNSARSGINGRCIACEQQVEQWNKEQEKREKKNKQYSAKMKKQMLYNEEHRR